VRNTHSEQGKLSRYRDGLLYAMPGWERHSLFHTVQTVSEARPATYPTGTGDSFTRRWSGER
jgi:hypothetical protein